MKNGSVALSVLGTIAVAGYLCYTEFPFWERWTKKEASQNSSKPKLIKRKKKPKTRKARTRTEKAPTKSVPPSVKKYRNGDTGVYLIDKKCDCQQNFAFMLDTVELTPTETILNILNARQLPVSAYPGDNKYAQHLLEWRYLDNGDRARLNLKETRGIATFPATSKPLQFQLIFPRVSDEAPKFQLTGKASTKLDYFSFVSINLDKKLPKEQAENHDAFSKCGFNAVTNFAEGQKKRFSAHNRPGVSGFRWSTSPELEVVGSSSKNAAKIRGVSAGKGEVCLSARFDGASCRYCQDISVKPENDDAPADFAMTKCGGLPSRDPHWQFTVTEPKRGATYSWEIEPGLVKRSSGRQKTFHATPNLRPGRFKVTLTATKSGKKTSTSREYHNVYSCVKRF